MTPATGALGSNMKLWGTGRFPPFIFGGQRVPTGVCGLGHMMARSGQLCLGVGVADTRGHWSER